MQYRNYLQKMSHAEVDYILPSVALKKWLEHCTLTFFSNSYTNINNMQKYGFETDLIMKTLSFHFHFQNEWQWIEEKLLLIFHAILILTAKTSIYFSWLFYDSEC